MLLELKKGRAVCVFAPMGENGLEGFQYNDTYKYQKMENNGKPYYRVYLESPDSPNYYETCGVNIFNHYFKEIES